MTSADEVSRVIVLLFGKMEHGGPFWCYVAIKPSQYEAFQAAKAAGTIDLYQFDEFGEVVVSAEGGKPPQSVSDRVAEMYGVDPATFFRPSDPMAEIDQKVEELKRAGIYPPVPNPSNKEPAPESWVAKVARPRKSLPADTSEDP